MAETSAKQKPGWRHADIAGVACSAVRTVVPLRLARVVAAESAHMGAVFLGGERDVLVDIR